MNCAKPFPLFVSLLLLLVPGIALAQEGEDWISLFDGSSLDGWTAAENPDSFQVVDGELVVDGPRAHLFYTGDVGGASFRNFELRLEAKTTPGANSGVYLHTKFQERGWPAWGYEAQVNSTHGDPKKTGGLYGVADVNPSPSTDGQWFEYGIRVVDKRIVLSVDGAVTTDYTEPADVRSRRRLGEGTIAIQAHDPESVVYYRNIRIRILPDAESRTRAQLVDARSDDLPWWRRMDYGPFLSASVAMPGTQNVAIKGITVELTKARTHAATFDTDLLRMAFAWEGWLDLKGVTYDGSHGGHPLAKGTAIMTTAMEPGWSTDGTFRDPRDLPFGPIPREEGRYLGLYRSGDDVTFEYEIAGARVRDLPRLEEVDGVTAFARELEIAGATSSLYHQVAHEPGRAIEISEDGRVAIARPAAKATIPAAGERADEVFVLVDRVGDADLWSDLSMGAPATSDHADVTWNAAAKVTAVEGFAPAHPSAGAEDGVLSRVNDGEAARNFDDTRRSTWLDGKRARWMLDLGKSIDVKRVNTFSWHRSNRAPQRFTLWAATGEEAPEASGEDLAAAGWRKLADVDSTRLGFGGKHGSCVTNLVGSLGECRWLLWDMASLEQGYGMFISEIDVHGVGDELPELKEPRVSADTPAPLTLRVFPHKSASAARFTSDEAGRIVLALPTGQPRMTLKVVASREVADPGFASLAEFAPATMPLDLSAGCQGGPSLYPEALTVQGVPATDEDAAYVVDDIPIPFENPWDSYMRVGAFDFFADGKRAAVSTWNGDVWIVSGLGGEDWGEMTWRRYATGLFETLGLKIVDDVVFVHGKDQITRLHDLDGDGEADHYACFTNAFYATRNFHEFPFDLQTDANGNFYVSKAAPVRGGGRGFDRIAPHHGTVLKISPDGSKVEVYARGMRAPNGIGVSPTGQVTAGDNEGTWVPHCKLHWLAEGSFQGVVDVAEDGAEPPSDYNPPLCWFPMEVDNSGGGQTWVTSDRWGPFTGDLLHLTYGKSGILKVMKEDLGDGRVQGGVFRLPVKLASSAMRGRFNPTDGQLYVCGLRGWQTNAARLAGFQRVRYTGEPVRMPKNLRVTPTGLEVEFTCQLDRELAEDPESYAVQMWDYVWGPMYGSPEVSVRNPDPQLLERAQQREERVRQHDKVEVLAARLYDDGRTVAIDLVDPVPCMQMHLKVDLEDTEGNELVFDLYNTIHEVPGAEKK